MFFLLHQRTSSVLLIKQNNHLPCKGLPYIATGQEEQRSSKGATCKFYEHFTSNEALLKFDAIVSSLTDKLVFNNLSLKTVLLLFYIALFYSTLYFISFV